MFLIINMLDIQQYSVGKLHQAFKLTKKWFRACKRLSRCVKTSIDVTTFGFLKKFKEKVYVQQCLTTTYSNAAILAPVTTITFYVPLRSNVVFR